MKVYHITNLHKNTLTESHKYKMKYILLEIKSLKLNLFKNKACQSVTLQIQHWWCNHSHNLSALYVTDVFNIWPFQLLILFSSTIDGVFWLGTFIIFSNIMLYRLGCITCNDPFPAPGSNSVIFLSFELYNKMPYLQLCLLKLLLNDSDWHNKTCRLWSYGKQDTLEPNQWWKIHCMV